MNNNFSSKLPHYAFMLFVFCIIFFPLTASASIEIEGIIIHSHHAVVTSNNTKLHDYTLRIRTSGTLNASIITARMQVTPASAVEEQLRAAISSHNRCYFRLFPEGIGYRILNIMVIRSGGLGRMQNSEYIISADRDTVYLDGGNNTVMHNNQTIRNSITTGNAGIQIGN